MKQRIWFVAAMALIAGFGFFGLVTKAGADIKAPETKAIPAKTLTMRITAYASVPEETDNTPFTTANGTHVHDGIVASNILPFGTKIQIPALFGNKIFTVEDRMNQRIKNTIDIWMANVPAAVDFGVARTSVIVLEGETSSAISEAIPTGRITL